MSNILRLTVDEEEPAPKIKGAFQLPPIENIQAKVVEISSDLIASGIGRTLKTVYDIIENLPLPPNDQEISEICFKLTIDARGEVSLLSTLKGGIAGQSAIEFKIKRKS